MIKKFLAYRKNFLLFYMMILFLFPLEHYVYGVAWEPVIYLVEMITFLLALYLVLDGIFFCQKYRLLLKIEDMHSLSPACLPKTYDSLETKYQDIIQMLYSLSSEQLMQLEERHTEQLEYYNLWVHQIKTPISALRLLLSQEKDTFVALRYEQELFTIEQYVEMALQYLKIEDLTLTSSGSTIRTGGSDLLYNSYGIKNMLTHCVKKYSTFFIQKKLSVSIETQDESILTDEKWFCFMIEQLLSNALKYTQTGSIRMYTQEGTNHLSLFIEDTGIGIRDDDLPRIFERGYTGYNGRIDKKASGIGLYLVKKVSALLSVDVLITSTLGKGTHVQIIMQNWSRDKE